jgi:hypothetical protein
MKSFNDLETGKKLAAAFGIFLLISTIMLFISYKSMNEVMLTCFDTDEKILYQIGRGKKRVSKTSIQQKWNSAPATFR